MLIFFFFQLLQFFWAFYNLNIFQQQEVLLNKIRKECILET